MTRIVKRGVSGLLISIILIFLDQFTKLLAVKHLKEQNAFVILENVFELRYLENRGAAFGIMQGQKLFFIVFTSIALVGITWFYLKMIPSDKKYFFLEIISILLFSGAIGNLIDRIRLNYVIDFFYFKLIDFPIFNVADIYVTVAAFAMFGLGLFYYKDEDYDLIFPSKKEKSEKEYAD